jgi:hypothetical protein
MAWGQLQGETAPQTETDNSNPARAVVSVRQPGPGGLQIIEGLTPVGQRSAEQVSTFLV